MNRKRILIGVIITSVCLSITLLCLYIFKPQRYDYGVFLGVDKIDVSYMSKYDLIIIDAASVEKDQIAKLQAKGTKVYSYLNIGTVETYRDYYDYCYENGLLLDVYGDWPDEWFIDVSDALWQNYTVNTIAADLTKQGIDGFFLDNFDVYYNYGETEPFLNGLICILQGLKNKYSLPIMVNGGDVAVKEILKIHSGLIDSVNQECVFTNIDFDNSRLTKQDAETTRYYMDYIAECKEYGLDVYILEYGNKVAKRIIKNYCVKNDFKYYVSKDLNLTVSQY